MPSFNGRVKRAARLSSRKTYKVFTAANYVTEADIVTTQNLKMGAPVEFQMQGDNWLNREIARNTGTDWDRLGFHPRDPQQYDATGGRTPFADPAHSMTNSSSTWQVVGAR